MDLYKFITGKKKDPVDILQKHSTINADSLHQRLIYRSFDSKSKIFHNSNSLGFGFIFSPLSGANVSLLEGLNASLKEKFPTGKKYSYQVQLVSNNKIQEMLDYNEHMHSKDDGMYADIAKTQKLFYEMGAKNGLPSGYGKHTKFDFRNYTAFLFVTTINNNVNDFEGVREEIKNELELNQFSFIRDLGAEELLNYVSDIFNYDSDSLRKTKKTYNNLRNLNQQIISLSTSVNRINKNFIDVEFDNNKKSRIVCLTAENLPQTFAPWNFPELLASHKNLGMVINCPHIISLSFYIEESLVSEKDSEKKVASLKKIQQMISKMKTDNPFMQEEISDHEEIMKKLQEKKFLLAQASFDIILFTNENDYKNDVSRCKKTLLKYIRLSEATYIQAQILESNLPFRYIDFIKDRFKSMTTHKLKTSNVVSFLPVFADVKLAHCGLTFSGSKNQYTNFNLFDMDTDSYNAIIAGAMGSGKSVLAQSIILSVLARGGLVYAMDYGRSYEKLTRIIGGNYIDHNSLFLNPFSHLNRDRMLLNESEIGEGQRMFDNTLKMIAYLYCILVDPEAGSSQYNYSILLDCIGLAYKKKANKTIVDDVYDEVKIKFLLQNKIAYEPRLNDILVNLEKFKVGGHSGEILNKASLIDPNANFVCVEMEGLTGGDAAIASVAMIIDISNRIYGSRDNREKIFLIEEAWKNLKADGNKDLREAIEEAAKTFRKKHASLVLISQNISDFYENDLVQAIYSTSVFKIVMRQGEKFFDSKSEYGFDEYDKEMIRNFRPSSEARFSSLLLKSTNGSTVHRFFLDPMMKIITTTKAEESSFIEKLKQKGMSLQEVIKKAAWHFYGDEMQSLENYKIEKQKKHEE